MIKKSIKISMALILLSIPLVLLSAPFIIKAAPAPSFKSTAPAQNGITSIGAFLGNILKVVWLIFAAFAIIMFIIAGIKFFSAQGDPQALGVARQFVIWGVIGIVVAVVGFSMVAIVKSAF